MYRCYILSHFFCVYASKDNCNCVKTKLGSRHVNAGPRQSIGSSHDLFLTSQVTLLFADWMIDTTGSLLSHYGAQPPTLIFKQDAMLSAAAILEGVIIWTKFRTTPTMFNGSRSPRIPSSVAVYSVYTLHHRVIFNQNRVSSSDHSKLKPLSDHDAIWCSTGFEILHVNIATGAFHDSGERFDPLKFHPKTCVATSRNYAEDTRHNGIRAYFVVYGSAGAGKSAIAQSIAEHCAELGLLVASFFFSMSSQFRNNEKRLIPSIAFQLALSIPASQTYIESAVQINPAIFERSSDTQIETLIIQPLENACAVTNPEVVKRLAKAHRHWRPWRMSCQWSFDSIRHYIFALNSSSSHLSPTFPSRRQPSRATCPNCIQSFEPI